MMSVGIPAAARATRRAAFAFVLGLFAGAGIGGAQPATAAAPPDTLAPSRPSAPSTEPVSSPVGESPAQPAEEIEELAPADSVAPRARDYAAFFREFLGQRADSTHAARVANLDVHRDAATFALEEGEVRLATPIEGRVCGLVFTGRGTFTFTPRTRVEREQLARVYGTATLRRPFTSLVLLFADTTLAELSRTLTFTAGARVKEPGLALRECLRYVSHDRSQWVTTGLAQPLLEGRGNGYCFAQIDPGGNESRLFYELDPRRGEAVTLYLEPRTRQVGLMRVYRRDVLCRFARAGADTLPAEDVRPVLAVERMRVTSRIASNLAFSAVAELDCRATEPLVSWAPFTIYDRLDVDEVTWADGTPARFFKSEEGSQLWVNRERPLAHGQRMTLRIAYRGPLIQRIGDWMFVESPTLWVPQPEGWTRAPMELTFHAPSQYHLVSVGEERGRETQGGVTISRWASDRPIRGATFVLGVFTERPIGPPEGPEARALMMKGMSDSVSFTIGERRYRMGGRMDLGVAEDAGAALAFFQRQLGPPLAPVVRVVEMPALGGEAFPGISRLTWTTYSGPNAAAEDAVFRAHEVAHQWWGVDVDFQSYRDQWISEGFADYSALWYLQAGRNDSRSYLAVLDQWRDDILTERRRARPGVLPLAPVWLGSRSATFESPQHFQLTVYKKGAWVLHMLRNLMLDLKTMDDERFASMLRDFYARFAGRTASTAEFRRLAERYAGEDLGWFFDQWVYGAEIPTYRFAWRSERTAEGKHRVTCRIEQKDVPEGFRMPVPIRVDFADGRFTWVRVLVQSGRGEFDLPLMDLEPRQVVFNDLNSVLCNVETVKW